MNSSSVASMVGAPVARDRCDNCLLPHEPVADQAPRPVAAPSTHITVPQPSARLCSVPVQAHGRRVAPPLGVTMLTLTDCHMPGTMAAFQLPPRPCGRKYHEHPDACRHLYLPDNRHPGYTV